jgi:malonate-semialdehyde dehydrogenase (acetylating) / methylmalonate-semialdehyde dehydrogenase
MYCRRFPHLRTVQSRSFHSSSHLKALGPLAIQKAEQISSQWKGTSATGGTTKNFIDGEFIESKTTEWIDTHDPVCNTLNGSYFQTNEHSQHKPSLRAFHKPQTRNS